MDCHSGHAVVKKLQLNNEENDELKVVGAKVIRSNETIGKLEVIITVGNFLEVLGKVELLLYYRTFMAIIPFTIWL